MKYLYKAKNDKGDIISGTVTANNDFEAEKILFDNKLIAMDLVPERSLNVGAFFKSKVTPKDRALFARQLATMVGAGLTLTKSVSVAANNARNDKLKQIFFSIYKDLEEGSPFSAALAKHPEAFDRVFISVVKSGETTGNLDTVLSQSADRLENDNDFVSKIKGAMYYPAFIFIALIGIAIYMMIKVIPQLETLFTKSGAPLPVATRFLLWLSHFMSSKWWLVLIILVVLIFAIRAWYMSETGARAISRFQLTFPGIKNLSTGVYMTRFSRIMEMLIKSGVPLLDALKIISSTINNHLLEEQINQMVVEVERGVPLSTPMQRSTHFPKLIGQMISVGEQTGKLDQVLSKVAQYYEDETSNTIKSLSSLIEPVILLIVGAGVAFLIFAILLPIYQVAQYQ